MENKKLIYAIDDEKSIRELYVYALESSFEVKVFSNAKELFLELENRLCDLLLLDIMLPDTDGFEILKTLKSNPKLRYIKIIMVSAKGDEVDKVKGLNNGADDYLSKPFGVLELVARINANLRKDNLAINKSKTFKDLTYDENAYQIFLNKSPLDLTLKEYKLLKYFINHPNIVITRDAIFKDVWDDDSALETRTLDVHVGLIRKKISRSEAHLETIRGVGYILK